MVDEPSDLPLESLERDVQLRVAGLIVLMPHDVVIAEDQAGVARQAAKAGRSDRTETAVVQGCPDARRVAIDHETATERIWRTRHRRSILRTPIPSATSV